MGRIESNLKSCPFCGVIPTVQYHEGYKGWYIKCLNTLCSMKEVRTAVMAHIKPAEQAWNHRSWDWLERYECKKKSKQKKDSKTAKEGDDG